MKEILLWCTRQVHIQRIEKKSWPTKGLGTTSFSSKFIFEAAKTASRLLHSTSCAVIQYPKMERGILQDNRFVFIQRNRFILIFNESKKNSWPLLLEVSAANSYLEAGENGVNESKTIPGRRMDLLLYVQVVSAANENSYSEAAKTASGLSSQNTICAVIQYTLMERGILHTRQREDRRLRES
jgi:hypothetical protein